MRHRLLLINPAMTANGRRLPNAGGVATMEPLALGYVAALTPPHWDVRIVDEVLEDLPEDDGWELPSLVGLTSLTITVPRAYDIAARYRARGVPVVMGGVHATLLPEEVAGHVDTVFQGEAEGAWPELIRDFEAGRLRRIYTGGAPALHGLPQPRRDLYRRSYFLQLLSASRGCRYRCEFCTLWKMEGGQYRARPPEEVWAELGVADRPSDRRRGQAPIGVEGKAETSYGAAPRERNGSRPRGGGGWWSKPIMFTDENILTDRRWALALFGGLAERGFNRPYAVQASLDIADDEQLLQALKRSGCVTVLIGFESVSEESLRRMRKGVNLRIGVAHYKDQVDKLHAHGLVSSGTFMFGNDGDGLDIFERTAEFVVKAGIDVAHFGLLTPNPGTDLFDRLAREGRLLYTNFPQDYARYDLRTAVFQPLSMTPEQLEEGLVWATRAVGSWGVLARRAWGTLQVTRNPAMAAVAMRWNRTGLYQRVVA